MGAGAALSHSAGLGFLQLLRGEERKIFWLALAFDLHAAGPASFVHLVGGTLAGFDAHPRIEGGLAAARDGLWRQRLHQCAGCGDHFGRDGRALDCRAAHQYGTQRMAG